jgi:hypothetical protein
MLAFKIKSAIRKGVHTQNPRNGKLFVPLIFWLVFGRYPIWILNRLNDSEDFYNQSSQILRLYLEKHHDHLFQNPYLLTIRSNYFISFLVYRIIIFLGYAVFLNESERIWEADVKDSYIYLGRGLSLGPQKEQEHYIQ